MKNPDARQYTQEEVDEILAKNPENPFIHRVFGPSLLADALMQCEVPSAEEVDAKLKAGAARIRDAANELICAVRGYREVAPDLNVCSWHAKHHAVYLERDGSSLRIDVFHKID